MSLLPLRLLSLKSDMQRPYFHLKVQAFGDEVFYAGENYRKIAMNWHENQRIKNRDKTEMKKHLQEQSINAERHNSCYARY